MTNQKFLISNSCKNYNLIVETCRQHNCIVVVNNSFTTIEVQQKFSANDVIGYFDFGTHLSTNLDEQQIQFVIEHGQTCDCCKKNHSNRRNVVVVRNGDRVEVWGVNCFENAQNTSLIKLINQDETYCCFSEQKQFHQKTYQLQQVWDYVVNCRKLVVNKRKMFNEQSIISKSNQYKIDNFLETTYQSTHFDHESIAKWVDNNQWIDINSKFPILHAIETNQVDLDCLNQVVFVLNQYFIETAVANANRNFEVTEKKVEVLNGHLINVKICESQLGFQSTQLVFVDENNNLFVWYKSDVVDFDKDLYNDRISITGSYKGKTNLFHQPVNTITRCKIK